MTSLMDETTLEITRILDATPQRVFGAWLKREEWQAWLGPEGVSCDVPILEAHVGGRYRVLMSMPDGGVIAVAGIFRLIEEPWRLAFTWGAEGDDEKQSLVTITLRALGGKAELTLRQEGLRTRENRDAHGEGWGSALGKLERYLAQDARRP